MIKVIIADDHGVVRAGLRTLIKGEPSLELVAEATGGVEAVDLATRFKPDILLLDLSMPDMDGITVTQKVRIVSPQTKLLILTVHEDESLLRKAIQSGASGYVLKRAAETELISAINIVSRGDLYIDPAMARGLFVDPISKGKLFERDSVDPLTPRELEVLKLIVQGYTNRQIAAELNISSRTVEGHRANLSDKLGLHNRVELVRYAKERGLVV
jgi:two-component system response regulator NreC